MRRLDHDALRAIVTDPSELAKGARALDEGGLTSLARHGDRLFADAAGGMAMPYKVTVTIADAKVSARCTCMAARTRPFCKHAAALLVAWTGTPEAFVESERAPATQIRRTTKKGKADAAALMGDGVARVLTLVRELAATGVASVAEGRARTLEALAETLRADRLRRLSGRVARLAVVLASVEDGGDLPITVEAYAELLCDLLLTARKVERHLGGEPLDDRHVEELIGKTWRKTDRAPRAGLELVEYASRSEVTPTGFVVREARFVDAATGAHYAEKQIVPAFMARRTPPRPSRAGLVLHGAAGSMYPGYPPRRLDLDAPGEAVALDDATLGRVIDGALPGVAAALIAFQDHRKDVFAPDVLPVTVRIDAVVADGRLRVVDADDQALHLPGDELVADQLAGALRDARPRAVIGELVLDRALPVLVPRAIVLEADGRRWLRTVTTSGEVAPTGPEHGDWAAHARAAGASSAAVSLAEVRGEVAALLAQGLASFSARAVASPAARLGELGLARPAQILSGIPDKPEAERLEDVVRVHQVLGVALVRVVGTMTIARDGLVAVPTHPGVLIPRPERWLSIEESAGLDRWSAAAHAAHALAAVPAATLLDAVHPWWAHAALSPLVAAAVATQPGAVDQARRVLGSPAGRAAQRTAIRVLCAADLDAAPRHVAQVLGRDGDLPIATFALELIDAGRERRGDADAAAHRRQRRAITRDLARTLAQAGAADDRARAALSLADCGDDSAAWPLRLAFEAESVAKVREAAAVALGRLGDPDSLDRFRLALHRRDDTAKAAALALGESGDTRAIAALIDALVAGWRPALVLDCLRNAGAGAIPALHAAVAREPALGKRKGVRELLAPTPVDAAL